MFGMCPKENKKATTKAECIGNTQFEKLCATGKLQPTCSLLENFQGAFGNPSRIFPVRIDLLLMESTYLRES